MKIAILYICTGRYNLFFPSFYQSSEKYFLPLHSKHYFVFTDDRHISDTDKISVTYKECKGFPLDSLFRFNMFLQIKEALQKYDYIFFFNANMKFVEYVNDEILPSETDEGLCALLHPGYYRKCKWAYPYERNKKSTAFIKFDYNKNYKYYMGALFGGRTNEFLQLSSICNQNIIEDYNKKIIAIFHDESHLNAYLNSKHCKNLSPEFGFPEGWELPFKPKIMIVNKVRYDKYFDKIKNHSLIHKLYTFSLKSFKAIIWPFL